MCIRDSFNITIKNKDYNDYTTIYDDINNFNWIVTLNNQTNNVCNSFFNGIIINYYAIEPLILN